MTTNTLPYKWVPRICTFFRESGISQTQYVSGPAVARGNNVKYVCVRQVQNRLIFWDNIFSLLVYISVITHFHHQLTLGFVFNKLGNEGDVRRIWAMKVSILKENQKVIDEENSSTIESTQENRIGRNGLQTFPGAGPSGIK